MTTNWSDEDLQAHLEDDLRTGAFEMSYTPLNYWQMKAILEDNGLYLLQLYNPQKDCHDFTIMQGEAVIRANLGLMDVESFILHRNLKRTEHPNWVDDSAESEKS